MRTLVLLALPVTLAAMFPLGAHAGGGGGGGGGGGFFNTFTQTRNDCTDLCEGVAPGDQGTGSAFSSSINARNSVTATANANLGFVRAFVSVSVNDDPEDPVGFASGTAEGEFGDDFVIDGGALNGTDGSLDFLIAIGGGGLAASSSNDLEINPFPSASATHRTRVFLEASCFGCEIAAELFGSADEGIDSASGFITETLDFVFGERIDLFVEGISAASVSGQGIASADFANTIEWGGFTEVRASDGGVVTDYTVVADSGVDWSLPATEVPEPSAVAMGATGGVLLLLQRWFRRRREGAAV